MEKAGKSGKTNEANKQKMLIKQQNDLKLIFRKISKKIKISQNKSRLNRKMHYQNYKTKRGYLP